MEDVMKQLTVCIAGVALCAMTAITATTAFAGPNDLYGEPAPVSAADHTVVINHDTQYVNVTGGDVVKFIVHGQPYTWNFDTASNINVIDLNALLPAGSLHHTVRVYVARDPTYDGA
jgi:hypothetical protein